MIYIMIYPSIIKHHIPINCERFRTVPATVRDLEDPANTCFATTRNKRLFAAGGPWGWHPFKGGVRKFQWGSAWKTMHVPYSNGPMTWMRTGGTPFFRKPSYQQNGATYGALLRTCLLTMDQLSDWKNGSTTIHSHQQTYADVSLPTPWTIFPSNTCYGSYGPGRS